MALVVLRENRNVNVSLIALNPRRSPTAHSGNRWSKTLASYGPKLSVIDPPLISSVASFTTASEKFNAITCRRFPLTRQQTSIGGEHFTPYSAGFARVPSTSPTPANPLFFRALPRPPLDAL